MMLSKNFSIKELIKSQTAERKDINNNPGADEIDFMIAKGAGLDDGRYVIRGRLVEKKGPNVAFIV